MLAQRGFLEYLRLQVEDPLRAVLDAAPLDDEPLTEEDRLAIHEGLAEKANGDVVSHEDFERLLREAK